MGREKEAQVLANTSYARCVISIISHRTIHVKSLMARFSGIQSALVTKYLVQVGLQGRFIGVIVDDKRCPLSLFIK